MYTNCLTADSVPGTCSFDTAVANVAAVENRFATMPMLPAVPVYQPLNEEELHTSFEQAISDRVLVVNKQLSLKSGPLAFTSASRLQVHTEPLNDSALAASCRAARGNIWQRGLIFVGLALMFMLVGFDLMGLLVLYAR